MSYRVVYSFDKSKLLDEEYSDLIALDIPEDCRLMSEEGRNAFVNEFMYDYKVDIYMQSLVPLLDVTDFTRSLCEDYGMTPYLAHQFSQRVFEHFNTIL